MTELCELAVKWGCDKAPAIRHAYTPFYHRLFAGRPIRRVLEIGVYNGASLRMWQDYWPEAEIFGLDIESRFLFEEDRIHTRLCDAGNAGELARTATELGGAFDLIIDDGSHYADDQILAVETLLPFLTPSGIYVIEDVIDPDAVSMRVQTSHDLHKFDSVPPPLCDDNLIIIDKAKAKD